MSNMQDLQQQVVDRLRAQTVDRLRAQTVVCDLDGYHWYDSPASSDCPDCHGTSLKADPTYAPLLKVLLHPAYPYVERGRVLRDVDTLDTGKVLEALSKAIERDIYVHVYPDNLCGVKSHLIYTHAPTLKEAALLACLAALKERT